METPPGLASRGERRFRSEIDLNRERWSSIWLWTRACLRRSNAFRFLPAIDGDTAGISQSRRKALQIGNRSEPGTVVQYLVVDTRLPQAIECFSLLTRDRWRHRRD